VGYAKSLIFGKHVKIDGMDALDVGLVRTIAAVQEAGAIAAKLGGEKIKLAWQDQIDQVLTHGYATGAYHDSITVDEPAVTGTFIEVTVYTDVTNAYDDSYPFFLEYGTSRMPAYPTLTPAFEASRVEAVATIAAAESAVLNTWFPGSASGSALGNVAAFLEDVAGFLYWAGSKGYNE
jgi:hypothetical protein